MFFVFVAKVKNSTHMVGSTFDINNDKDFKFEAFQFVNIVNTQYRSDCINSIDVYMYDIFTGTWKMSHISIDYSNNNIITHSFEKNVIPPKVEQDIMGAARNWNENSNDSGATSIECINFFMWSER